MGRLKNKIALITGAATGQGKEIAKLFAAEGATVILTDMNMAGKETAAEISNARGDVNFVQMDVSKLADWNKVADYIKDAYNNLDILVNNAGIPGRGSIEEVTEDEWQKVMDVDAKGVLFGMKSMLPFLKKSKQGSIVNNSSIWALVGTGSAASYHAAKGAVRMLTKTASIEFAPFGIRVNSIHPGLVRTPMTERLLEDPKESWRIGPIGRAAEPIEIAYAALFLASNESSYITGIDLPVDGGYTAR
ncbi:glucose 1-dehydrogenase [Sporosarcina sp. ACRSM]|uniref:SDR family NAD(P)-dependent oxidoreductase n=1 Tax=Sporosarcina sp. ACRSM TaxID=2918216 RepID=UPI001EF5344C|nr:glucose 1-dehydrogenase [Sporosarcina sp. ACRSM]MCG7336190.1 glucose 1-dehydrogenase [Sporosarcina sp. ACRSM]